VKFGEFGRWRGVVLGLAVFAAMTGVLLGAWFVQRQGWPAFRDHPYFAVREIVMRGTGRFVSKEELRSWVGVRENSSLWEVAPQRLEERLERHPAVAHASVRRRFPGRFEVAVDERHPEALVLLDGRLYYADGEGRVFLALAAGHSRNYPVITGLQNGKAAAYQNWLVRQALRLLRLGERTNGLGEVSEIRLNPQYGVVFYPRRSRVPLILGWGSWCEKLRRARRVLEAWKGHTAVLAALDLRYRDQVVAKIRGGSEHMVPLPAGGKVAI